MMTRPSKALTTVMVLSSMPYSQTGFWMTTWSSWQKDDTLETSGPCESTAGRVERLRGPAGCEPTVHPRTAGLEMTPMIRAAPLR